MDLATAYKAGEHTGEWKATAIASMLVALGLNDSFEAWQTVGLVGVAIYSFYKYNQCKDDFAVKLSEHHQSEPP